MWNLQAKRSEAGSMLAHKKTAAIIDVEVASDSDEEGMMAAYRKKREKKHRRPHEGSNDEYAGEN